MKVILQRVNNASAWCDGQELSSIERGVVALVGINRDDTEEDMEYCIRKILRLKLWKNDEGKPWKRGVEAMGAEILLVSQFTLFALFDGNCIDFHRAMNAEAAEAIYTKMVEATRAAYAPEKVKTGMFGGYTEIRIANDGPVTIIVDSAERKKNKGK